MLFDAKGGIVAVRTAVQIDDELMARLRRLVPAGGMDRFVNEALAAHVDALERARVDAVERARVEATMREGYISTRADREQLNRDWDVRSG